MTGQFDPYHRWLGIPAAEQPANHYRLLGLVVYEDDPEVIRDAVEQRIVHVRGYALGQYSELSQKILNELAAARACLLDPERRAAYAASLRVHLLPPTDSVQSDDVYDLAPPIPVVRPPDVPQPLKLVEPFHLVNNPRPLRRAPTRHWKSLLAVSGAAAALLLAIGLVVSFRGSSELKPPAPSSMEQDQVVVGSDRARASDAVSARPPKLARISDRTVAGGSKIQFTVEVSDSGISAKGLRFGLVAGAPEGAAIDAQTGIFTWTPMREQAPGAYPVTVQILADGSRGLGDQTTFRVIVREPNRPRIIHPTTEQTVRAGSMSRFTIGVTPSAMCTFSLPEAPPWASIDSATGQVTCAPPPTVEGRYSVTVRVISNAMEDLRDEKTLTVAVIAPTNASPPQQQPLKHSPTRPEQFEISLLSGKVVTVATFDLRDVVRRDINALRDKCRENSPDALGLYQEGSQSVIAALCGIKGLKPHGPAVLFHLGQKGTSLNPRQYITYRSGKWDGPLATWDTKGHKEFYCNYLSGQRHGLCCLFNKDTLVAVLECTRNEIDAVHLIAANQVIKSLTDVDQASPGEAGPVLSEIESIEQRLKDDSRSFCERVKQGVNLRLGAINKKRREAFEARSEERDAAQQQQTQALRKAGGL